MARKGRVGSIIGGIIKGFIIFLVVTIIVPIALVFVMLFDTGKMKVNYDSDFNTDEWAKALVVDSLDESVTNKWAKFSISESDINNFINFALKDKESIKQYLTQLAVDVTEDSYVINASAKVSFFETRATISAKFSKEIVCYEGVEQEAFVLKFDKLTVGRITKMKELIMYTIKKFLNNQTLDALASAIKLHFDLDNSCAFIYTQDLRDILRQSVLGDSGMTEFYFTFISDFLDHNLVNFDFYANESLNIRISFERLIGNDYGEGQYVDYRMPYEETTTKLLINGVEKQLSLDVIREAVAYMMDLNLVDEANMHALSGYLFNGYNGHNAPEYDLTPLGILNKETYPGFNLVSIKSIDQIITDSIAHFTGYELAEDSFDLCNITETDFNDFIKRQSAFGHKYFLEREVEPGHHKINYIAVDNVYLNVTTNNGYISVGLNINGQTTWITLELEKEDLPADDPSRGKKVVYNVTAIYFGSKSEGLFVSEETESLIYSTLDAAIKEESFSFRDGKLTIGFDALIENAISQISTGNPTYDEMYRDFLMNQAEFNISVVGDAVTDHAVVKIQAKRP